jgi:hypothetical protein
LTGGVGGLGEAETLPSCRLPSPPPRAAITSLRNELLLRRDKSLSAVSGLLGDCQCSSIRWSGFRVVALCAASLPPTVRPQRIAAIQVARRTPLATGNVSDMVSTMSLCRQSHQGVPLLHFCFVSRQVRHAACCLWVFWIRGLLAASGNPPDGPTASVVFMAMEY